MRQFLSVGVIVMLAALVLSTTALAGDTPAKCVYHPEQCKKAVVKGATTGVKPTTTNVVKAASPGLPFTGTDVTFLLVGGVLFGLVGFGIRRSGRDKTS